MVFLFFPTLPLNQGPRSAGSLPALCYDGRFPTLAHGRGARGGHPPAGGVPPPSHPCCSRPPAAGRTMRDRCAPPPRSLPPWSSSPLLRTDEAPGGRYAACSPQHLLSHRLPSAPSRLEQEHGQNRAESQVLPALLPPAQELHIATAAGSSLWR